MADFIVCGIVKYKERLKNTSSSDTIVRHIKLACSSIDYESENS